MDKICQAENPQRDMELYIYRHSLDSFYFKLSHERTVYLFKPKPISWITGIIGYILNKNPEILDAAKVLSLAEGRDGI